MIRILTLIISYKYRGQYDKLATPIERVIKKTTGDIKIVNKFKANITRVYAN